MPQPSQAQVHVNRPLTNISVAFLQNPNNFVWDKVFPMIPVDKKSDLFFTYPLGQWLADDAQKRRPFTRRRRERGDQDEQNPAFHDVSPLSTRRTAQSG